MNTTDKILDKVKKLFALAERNNSPEEAASAAARAQEMLFENKLTMADVIADEDEAQDVLEFVDFDAPGHKWKKSLVHGVARAFYCQGCTLSRTNKVRIVGKTSDVQTVTYMAAYLVNEIDRLAKARAGMGKRWIASFKVGAVVTVIERLQAQKKAQDAYVATGSGDKALALRNDSAALQRYFKQLFPRTVSSGRPSATSNGGFEAGKEAGKNIAFGGGKGLGAPARQLGAMK